MTVAMCFHCAYFTQKKTTIFRFSNQSKSKHYHTIAILTAPTFPVSSCYPPFQQTENPNRTRVSSQTTAVKVGRFVLLRRRWLSWFFFTCVQEVGVGDYLRVILKQQVPLIPLGLTVVNLSTTPKA